MVAGAKLLRRNPSIAPANPIAKSALYCWSLRIAITKNAPAATAAVPAANPSMLSSKLNAFVIPKIHTTEMTISSQSGSGDCRTTPYATSTVASPKPTTKRNTGLNPRRSSIKPIAANTSANPSTTASSRTKPSPWVMRLPKVMLIWPSSN